MYVKTVYYAHCVSIYDTPQEDRDVRTLKALGFTVRNPNCPAMEEMLTAYNEGTLKWSHANWIKRGGDASISGDMRLFQDRVMECDVLAFRALPEGRISAGVRVEIQAAICAGNPVFELPSGIVTRGMSVIETRQYLKEVGQR